MSQLLTKIYKTCILDCNCQRHSPFVASDLGGFLVGVLLALVGTLALLGFHALVVVEEGTGGTAAPGGTVLGALEGWQRP